MQQDLIAAPKLSVRAFAKLVGGLGVATIVAGVAFALFREAPFIEIALRVLATIFVCASVTWAYAAFVKLSRRARPERLPLILAVISTLSIAAMLTNMAIMLPFFGSLWWQVPMMFGFMLAAAGWGRRVGDSMHCPACEYEFNFDEDEGPPRCPECAFPWLGHLKRGRRVRSPRLVVTGLITAMASAVLLNPIFYMPALGPHLPTPLLYAVLYAAPRSMYSSWDELGRRPLSDRWTRIMAERVLTYRNSNFFDQSPAKWLEAQINAGQVPSDLAEHFYADGFQARLVVPSRVKAGKPFEACLRVTHASQGKSMLVIMFGGYTLDGGPPIDRTDKMVGGFQLSPGILSSYHDAFQSALSAPRPGTVRVRAAYWVIYQPSWHNFHWQPDGTPEHPPDTAWFERRELEATVRVDP